MMSLPIVLGVGILAFSPSIALASHKEAVSSDFASGANTQIDRSLPALTEAKKKLKLMRNLTYSNHSLAAPEVENLSRIGNDVKSSLPKQMMSNIHIVRGNVDLPETSVVVGSICTNDGNIALNGVTVFGHIKAQQGDISLTGNTVIFGNVVIGQQINQNDKTNEVPPTVFVGGDVRILGRLIAHPSVEQVVENAQPVITHNDASLKHSL